MNRAECEGERQRERDKAKIPKYKILTIQLTTNGKGAHLALTLNFDLHLTEEIISRYVALLILLFFNLHKFLLSITK